MVKLKYLEKHFSQCGRRRGGEERTDKATSVGLCISAAGKQDF
jgi:hypothetical protein